MTWDELKERFPDLQPIRGMPWLFNFFGCGLMFYGGRDRDPELGSVVRTRYLCVLGIPTLALGSYRMVPTDHGWFLLGREPIARYAAWLNVVLLLLGLGGGAFAGVNALVSSEEFQARRTLERADALAASGRVDEAAALLENVAFGPTEASVAAIERLAGLVGRAGPIPAGQVAALFQASARVAKAGRWPGGNDRLYEAGMARVNGLAATDPGEAALALETVASLAPRGDDLAALRRDLLERAVAARPEDVDLASRLAAVYETENLPDLAAELLEPFRERLGESEGARILGLIDARAGRAEPALELLRTYTRARLGRLERAEAQLKAGVRAAGERLVDKIKRREAADFDYDDARRAGPGPQQRLVEAYIDRKLKDAPEIARLLDAVQAEAVVTPAALELGVLLLQRAQAQAAPETRTRLLAEAESAFLAIRRMAGDDPNYGVALGQVYFWEGKAAEGRAEFDRVLRAHLREPRSLLLVADALRELGSNAEARALADEAYGSSQDPSVRRGAATLRGLLTEDLDARLDWLRRGDPDEPFARAVLRYDEGLRALRDGDEPAAIRLFKESADLYEGLSESAEVMNNLWVVLDALATLTRDEAMAERAASLIERAAQLSPSNSLTVGNAARARLHAATADLIGRAIDLERLKMPASLALLHFLYDDQAGEDAMGRKVAGHPGIARYLRLQRNLMILAPRLEETYYGMLTIAVLAGDVAALRELERRIAAANVSTADRDRSDDAAMADRLVAARQDAEAIVAAARPDGHGPTLAVALARLAGTRLALARSTTDAEADLDAVVTPAEEAFAACRSVGTRTILIEALLSRTEARLARAEPEYAAILAKSRDDLAALDRVAAALADDGPFTAALVADPDVIRAAALARDDFENRPHSAGTRYWALLRPTHPEVAARVAETHRASQADQLVLAIREALGSGRPAAALTAVLVRLMEGRRDEAAAKKEEYREHGIDLPPIGSR